ncbi:MAG TPA: ATP-binding protein [bacterium]|nr:ATP-binding protein [bacterium]
MTPENKNSKGCRIRAKEEACANPPWHGGFVLDNTSAFIYNKSMKKHYIKRAAERRLLKFMKQFPVIALSGPRQAGKTTMLKQFLSKTHNFVSLDDLDNRARSLDDPKMFMTEIKTPCVIDEIQYAPKLLSYIKLAVDNDRKPASFILTGSQQFLLMKGLSETLAGRVGIMNLYPFNSIEAGLVKKFSSKKIFEKAALKGLYPEVFTAKNIDSSLWYESYIKTYIERDVKIIYNIGSLGDFNIILKMLASRAAQLLNISALSADSGIPAATIKRWISILEASGIIRLLRPFYARITKRLVKMPKVYFLDTGLLCALLKIGSNKLLYSGAFLGAVFENFCVSETIKILSVEGREDNLFFLRTNKGVEVDLMIENSSGFTLAEFKAGMSLNNHAVDNIVKIKKGFKNLKFDKSFVVSLNDRCYNYRDNVGACGAAGFLKTLCRPSIS